MAPVRWSAKDDKTLVDLVMLGTLTTPQIAAVLTAGGLAVTPNAVIGRRHRLRQRGLLPQTAHAPGGRPKVNPPIEPAAPPPKARSTAPDPVSIVPPPAPRPAGALGLGDPWPSRACRFPLFGGSLDRDAPIFCGADVVRRSYCAAHYRLVYLPPVKRGQADRKDRDGYPHKTGMRRHGTIDTEAGPSSR